MILIKIIQTLLNHGACDAYFESFGKRNSFILFMKFKLHLTCPCQFRKKLRYLSHVPRHSSNNQEKLILQNKIVEYFRPKNFYSILQVIYFFDDLLLFLILLYDTKTCYLLESDGRPVDAHEIGIWRLCYVYHGKIPPSQISFRLVQDSRQKSTNNFSHITSKEDSTHKS